MANQLFEEMIAVLERRRRTTWPSRSRRSRARSFWCSTWRSCAASRSCGGRLVDLAPIGARFALGARALADPEWQFKVWSKNGLDRAADNHYPTSPTSEIAARPLAKIAADDRVLFMWATIPMLCDALAVMAAAGFAYKSHLVSTKDKFGTGYWFREQHELLLVGTRGDVPAPVMGTQRSSHFHVRRGEHSEKPAGIYEIIEHLFPLLPKIELNARQTRLGWDRWGAEAETRLVETARWARAKRTVRVARPPDGIDFNDLAAELARVVIFAEGSSASPRNISRSARGFISRAPTKPKNEPTPPVSSATPPRSCCRPSTGQLVLLDRREASRRPPTRRPTARPSPPPARQTWVTKFRSRGWGGKS